MFKGSIVFFGSMEWGFSTHLWHHLARKFAKDYRVFYVDPLYATTGNRPLDVTKDVKEGSDVRVIRYGESFLYRVPLIKKVKIGRRVRRLGRELERLRVSDAILFFYNPWDAYEYRRIINDQMVIYYATDNAKELFHEPFKTQYVKRENWLCNRADLVLGVSRVLTESIAEHYPDKTFYVSQGVDLATFEDEEPSSSAMEGAGPRACFVGTLDDSLDWELLEHAAAALPKVEFLMVGPVKTDRLEKRFERFRNVRFLGYQKYEFLGKILSTVDVCFLMYKDTAFNRMRNPIKLLEYFAAGKIVVSTDFPGVHEYPQLVLIARDGQDFMKKIREAITENMSRKYCDKLKEIAKLNTWDRRKVEIEVLIEGLKRP